MSGRSSLAILAILALPALTCLACSAPAGSATKPPPAVDAAVRADAKVTVDAAHPAAPCAATLGTTAGDDLTLLGTGACATTIRLGLRVATGSPTAATWTSAATSPLRVDGAWKLEGGVATRPVSVTNTSAAPVTLVGLEWATDSGGVGLAVDRLVHDGYQSWTYTGVESIPATMTDANGTAPNGGDDENLVEVAGVSWWWTAVTDANGNGLVAGADGGTVLKTYIAADGAGPVRVRIVAGVTGDAIVLAPGASIALDGLYLALGDVGTNLDAYAKYVAALHPPAAPRSAPLGGWGSWNLYFDTITAASLASEATWASATLAPLTLDTLLLDDGYETYWGSWAAAPAFGASLASVASSEASLRLRPAIWLAPFYVNTTDPIVAANPDWFVHNADGSLRTYNNYGPTNAALDVTSAGARAFVTGAFQQLVAWGISTFKIDFLFGGALEGVRQGTVTSLQSFQMWMKTIREAVPTAHLIGCGAPMLPSVGWVDSMRVGADISYSVNPEPNYSFFSFEARHVAMRAVTDAWWGLDPDVVLLRGTSLTDAEAWTVAVYSAMAGGNYLLGDGQEAGALRLAFATAPDVLAITRDGVAARASDLVAGVDPMLFASPLLAGEATTWVPHVWKKTTADGSHGWLAVFGWGVDGYSTSVELPSGAEEIVPPTSPGPTTRTPLSGVQTVSVGMHEARLFRW